MLVTRWLDGHATGVELIVWWTIIGGLLLASTVIARRGLRARHSAPGKPKNANRHDASDNENEAAFEHDTIAG